jgi:hypothetical protein
MDVSERLRWTDHSWQTAAKRGAGLFAALAGFEVLSAVFASAPLEVFEVVQAALLGTEIALVGWAAPRLQEVLKGVSPEQLRVTAAGLMITGGFIVMSATMEVGEPDALRGFLQSWPLWVGIYLPMGMVLAMVAGTAQPDASQTSASQTSASQTSASQTSASQTSASHGGGASSAPSSAFTDQAAGDGS